MSRLRHGNRAGVPSFCAVAAKLQQPLCEKDEALIVIPGNNAHRKELLALEGSKVIMKPSGRWHRSRRNCGTCSSSTRRR